MKFQEAAVLGLLLMSPYLFLTLSLISVSIKILVSSQEELLQQSNDDDPMKEKITPILVIKGIVSIAQTNDGDDFLSLFLLFLDPQIVEYDCTLLSSPFEIKHKKIAYSFIHYL